MQFQNIRHVYRMLNLNMPVELDKQLKESGAIMWEHFTKTAVNKFDIKSIMSQNLGAFETGLVVLPPVSSMMHKVPDEENPGLFKH